MFTDRRSKIRSDTKDVHCLHRRNVTGRDMLRTVSAATGVGKGTVNESGGTGRGVDTAPESR